MLCRSVVTCVRLTGMAAFQEVLRSHVSFSVKVGQLLTLAGEEKKKERGTKGERGREEGSGRERERGRKGVGGREGRGRGRREIGKKKTRQSQAASTPKQCY